MTIQLIMMMRVQLKKQSSRRRETKGEESCQEQRAISHRESASRVRSREDSSATVSAHATSYAARKRFLREKNYPPIPSTPRDSSSNVLAAHRGQQSNVLRSSLLPLEPCLSNIPRKGKEGWEGENAVRNFSRANSHTRAIMHVRRAHPPFLPSSSLR